MKIPLCLALLVLIAIAPVFATDHHKHHRRLVARAATAGADFNPVVSCTEICEEYDVDPKSADRVYKNKKYRVFGNVTNLYSQRNPYVYLGAEPPTQGTFVQCYFDNSARSQIAKLKMGERVDIVGICDGYSDGPVFRNCTIVTTNTVY
jgi:hypothetical protein